MTIITMTLLILFSIGLFWAGVQLHRLQKQLHEQQLVIKKLSSELNATTSGTFGIGNSLISVEKQIKDLRNRQQDMASFGNDDQYQKRTYKQATHLAQMGASIDELKQSCELSHGEAELLAHLNLSQSH